MMPSFQKRPEICGATDKDLKKAVLHYDGLKSEHPAEYYQDLKNALIPLE